MLQLCKLLPAKTQQRHGSAVHAFQFPSFLEQSFFGFKSLHKTRPDPSFSFLAAIHYNQLHRDQPAHTPYSDQQLLGRSHATDNIRNC